MLPSIKTTIGFTCALAFCASAQAASGQSYPNKPITIVVPFAAGSGTDQQARIFAQALTSEYKVPVVVDNRAGASGFIASQHVARAEPDGYTLLMTTNTTHAANAHLFKKLPYDPVKDFTPVTLLGKGQMMLVVQNDSPIKSISDLLAAAQQRPGKMNFGSGSSSSRVAGEMLKQLSNIDVVNIPYKSNPMAVTDLMGGQVDFMFADGPTAIPQINAKKLRALATSGSRRLSIAPSIPTVAESGVKGYDMTYWTGVYLPAKADPSLVQRLNEMFIKIAGQPEWKRFQETTAGDVATTTPEGLAQFQAAESQKWGRIIKAAGIIPD
ncbi:ABC transporter substrate-binding protein [Advenella kashmirensis W13003]|uniref:ABC transporter substrate-binding protein n=1 Tax=Advenella kashmirensis W13003 TaxID=1424334 RepID=V8QY37_9BURK|nr:tripartite tricarboxylate transporter substrate binding protein [Advenella kashmirensis]ETF04288.1 ABC transporter substrate-binding protein [Advenella kashmirensis W13003]